MPRTSPSRSPLAYALAIMALAWSALAGASEVAVVISEDTPTYREVADTIRSRLAPSMSVSIVKASALGGLKLKPPNYLVAVGSQAAQTLVASDLETPLLVTLLPKSAVDRLIAENRRGANPRALSAVYLDQPIGRQLDFIRLILPEATRIGVLLGSETGKQYAALQAAALDKRLRLVAQKVEHEAELAPTLLKLLPDIDVLLALPDPAVFNAGTIQFILLASYRQRLPLIGFSASYVRAGAIASLHSTPVHIGEQAADMLAAAPGGSGLPPPQYPRHYIVATNPHVARSLGILIESEETLMQRMRVSGPR